MISRRRANASDTDNSAKLASKAVDDDDVDVDIDVPAVKSKSKAKGKAKSKAKIIKDEPSSASEESQSEDDVVPKAKAKGKGKAKSKAGDASKSTNGNDANKPATQPAVVDSKVADLKSEIVSGKKRNRKVDEYVPNSDKCVVHEGYDATLSQTDIGNNNNKYFILQVVKNLTTNLYHSFFRWGRVGHKGTVSFSNGTLYFEFAEKQFHSKFFDKTNNGWMGNPEETFPLFKRYNGKYELILTSYEAEDEDDAKNEEKLAELKEKRKKMAEEAKELCAKVKMDDRLKSFVAFISNTTSATDATLKHFKYDASKVPLGRLAKDTIIKAFKVLQDIESAIAETSNSIKKWSPPNDSISLHDARSSKAHAFEALSNKFYSFIPHDFGFGRSQISQAIIDDLEKVKQKTEMLEALSELKVQAEIMDLDVNVELSETELLIKNYVSLGLTISPVEKESKLFTQLDNFYVKSCVHKMSKYKVIDIFEVSRPSDQAFIDTYENDPSANRHLMWHGSRITNWMGILKQGLRIAPPEAPVTGYMFGKGVYFADRSSKSANYLCTYLSDGKGVISLCEVVLGKVKQLKNADYRADLWAQKGFDSVQGVGTHQPDAKKSSELENGCIVPDGPTIDFDKECLMYNEFIVYDIKQIRMRYVMIVECDY